MPLADSSQEERSLFIREGKTMKRAKKINTTLGDLIVALTDETGRYVGDERERYRLVAVLLSGMLKNSGSLSSIRPALLAAQALL